MELNRKFSRLQNISSKTQIYNLRLDAIKVMFHHEIDLDGTQKEQSVEEIRRFYGKFSINLTWLDGNQRNKKAMERYLIPFIQYAKLV